MHFYVLPIPGAGEWGALVRLDGIYCDGILPVLLLTSDNNPFAEQVDLWVCFVVRTMTSFLPCFYDSMGRSWIFVLFWNTF